MAVCANLVIVLLPFCVPPENRTIPGLDYHRLYGGLVATAANPVPFGWVWVLVSWHSTVDAVARILL